MAAYFEQGSPAMQQLTAIVDRIEQMLDHAGFANLFYALEVVCSVFVIQVGLCCNSTMLAALAPCAIVLAKLIQCHAELGLVLALAR